MMAKPWFFAFVFLAACSLIAGCGDSGGPQLGTVTGTVTLNGEPLEGAQVTFQPERGRPSSGITDSQGKYELQYTLDRPGAMVGSHRVSISTAVMQNDDSLAPERVPPKYNAQSELVREVKPAENVYDFELNG